MNRLALLSRLGISSLLAFIAAGCSSSASEGGAAGGADLSGGATSAGGAYDGSEPGGGSFPSNPTNGQGTTPAGTLTAADWDDNLNFDIFRSYVKEQLEGSQVPEGFPSADRVILEIDDEDGSPISNAHVDISAAGQHYLSAPTASDGRVLFFPKHDGANATSALTLTVTPPAGQGNVATLSIPLGPLPPTTGADPLRFTLPGAKHVLPTELDLAFVIDATGSMGDELGYVTQEVQGIADGVKAQFKGVSVRYGLIVYRDEGDAYVTRSFDFTTDLNAFKASIGAQSADGGGDFPEAMDKAVALVPKLTFRTGNTARMAFLIADAPPHENRMADYWKGVNALRPLGIKLYPVAASGVDPDAEYVMRAGAEATLGRYLFLTDDSGVGDSHEKPHIPCYQVQKLNTLIGRVIASELTGTRVPATVNEVIRSVGDPMGGVCKLPDGGEAHL